MTSHVTESPETVTWGFYALRLFRRDFTWWRRGESKMQISMGVRSRSVMEGMLMEAITLDAWLEYISSE